MKLFICIAHLLLSLSALAAIDTLRLLPTNIKHFGLSVSIDPLMLTPYLIEEYELPSYCVRAYVQVSPHIRLRGLIGPSFAPKKLSDTFDKPWGMAAGAGVDVTLYNTEPVRVFVHSEYRKMRASYEVAIYRRSIHDRDIFIQDLATGDIRATEIVVGVGVQICIFKFLSVEFGFSPKYVRRGVFTDNNLYTIPRLTSNGPFPDDLFASLLERNTFHEKLRFDGYLALNINLIGK